MTSLLLLPVAEAAFRATDGGPPEKHGADQEFEGHVMLPHDTSLPTADCDSDSEKGRIFLKRDASSGQWLYVCEGATNGWVLQGPTPGYQTIQVNGTAVTKRTILNLTSVLQATDDPAHGWTNLDLLPISPLATDLTIRRNDPTLLYDTISVGDTDFWAGVVDDAGLDDDDSFRIGSGPETGLRSILTITAAGNVGVGNTAPAAKFLVDFPPVQTIAAGTTVRADACGTLKLITSAGAVTTDTTNTFIAPSAANQGCLLHVCNVGASNITLDNNANFKSAGAADVVLTADDCVEVASMGISGPWTQLSPLSAN